MTKPLSSKQLLFPGITAIFVLIAACNSGPADNTQAAQSAESAPLAQITLSKYLDTLYVDSADFVKLDTGKIVFQFRIGGLDTLTMDGWTAPKNDTLPFLTNPDIQLLKGRIDSVQILEPSLYFGNQILRKNQVAKIKTQLASKKAHYVLFVPLKDNGHVTYNIFVGFDKPAAKEPVVFTTPPSNTNEGLNPSPPKSYAK